ncbi:hypothetical protein [Sphaerisporangium flaviroseum]|uniref:hypothetical protein n=1 Tax=Sphaerisporangium flaviroseum TaxID=509199 RepID=UPI0031EA366C
MLRTAHGLRLREGPAADWPGSGAHRGCHLSGLWCLTGEGLDVADVLVVPDPLVFGVDRVSHGRVPARGRLLTLGVALLVEFLGGLDEGERGLEPGVGGGGPLVCLLVPRPVPAGDLLTLMQRGSLSSSTATGSTLAAFHAVSASAPSE